MTSLTVFCPLGLSNRLQVLLSGLALAEASGRDFKMLWPLTPACAAPFDSLFANLWPVETVTATTDVSYISGWFGKLPDLLTAPQPDVIIGYPDWLVKPNLYPNHQPLLQRCEILLDHLQPVPAIQETVHSFREAHFRPTMIGVHLRRGDLLQERPDSAANTVSALQATDHLLEQFPRAGILLCSDDGAVNPIRGREPYEGVHALFRHRYGELVVWTHPRSLNRRIPAAIQDGLVDLWLLRHTDAFVGTHGSAFSGMAVFGRDVPAFFCSGETAKFRRLTHLLQFLRLYQPLQNFGRQRYNRDIPIPVLWHAYTHWPWRLIGRLLKRVSPQLYQRLRSQK